jgi:hypothetical protein
MGIEFDRLSSGGKRLRLDLIFELEKAAAGAKGQAS